LIRSGQFYLFGLIIIIGSIMWGLYEKAVDISIEKQCLPRPIIGAEKPIRFFGVVSRYSPRKIYRGYQPISLYY
jgi:hypothetical protein